MHRLVIFTEGKFRAVPALLTRAALAAAAHRHDVQVVGVCVRNPPNAFSQLYRHTERAVAGWITTLFRRGGPEKHDRSRPLNFRSLPREHGLRLLFPRDNNINHPEFVRLMETEVKPDLGLSFYCLQRFRPPILAQFRMVVNYHNGLLPKYGGLMATGWSVYCGEERSGFTFHRMNEGIDKGPLLLQGAVAIRPESSASEIEHEKAAHAAGCMPRLLEMMVNDDPGQPQGESGSYFSAKQVSAIRTVSDPSAHVAAELVQRMRAFGSLTMKLNGKWYRVKQIGPATVSSRKALSFRSWDGILMQATRFRRR